MQQQPSNSSNNNNNNNNTYPPFWTDPRLPWAVDMDGTLIAEDVTERALDIALTDVRYWIYGVVALLLYYSGMFQITAYRILERFVPVPPATLTYHFALCQALQRHARRGGTVVLATASHVQAARKVAHYVETMLSEQAAAAQQPDFLFDDVIGSHPPAVWDACGECKAHLIAARFGSSSRGGFVYAGNSADDLHVWRHAACVAMILVNCPPAVQKQAIQIGKPYVILEKNTK